MTPPVPPAGQPWPRARIEALLRAESFDYQAIALPHGLTTGGHDRSGTARLIFPDDLKGESVLDVGSSLGYFCFAARRQGAGRVLGIDLDRSNVRKARLLADILAEPVEFKAADLERDPVEERFDHVLCLNVLHHVGDPILALDRLIAATRRRLVLELATLGAHDRRKLGITWLEQLMFARLPALIVGRGTASEGIKQYYVTPQAIDNLLRYRRGCFASVETLPSDFKGRFIVIAHKRRIGRLLVIGGPTASGKRAFMRKLLDQEFPALSRRLGVEAASRCPVLFAEDYHKPQDASLERLVLHYDILRPFALGAGTFEHDPALDILEAAESATILTLWAPPDQLIRQTDSALNQASGRSRKRLARVRSEVGEPRRVLAHYRAWFAYCARKTNAERLVVSLADGAPAVMSQEEWDAAWGSRWPQADDEHHAQEPLMPHRSQTAP